MRSAIHRHFWDGDVALKPVWCTPHQIRLTNPGWHDVVRVRDYVPSNHQFGVLDRSSAILGEAVNGR
jgi:hypothetical protein